MIRDSGGLRQTAKTVVRVDVDGIRSTLADARIWPKTAEQRQTRHDAERRLEASHVRWLTALCDEVERLEADLREADIS